MTKPFSIRFDDVNISSSLALKYNLPEVTIIWLPSYCPGCIGSWNAESNLTLDGVIGALWSDNMYTDESSWSMSSVIVWTESSISSWPFLNTIKGFPLLLLSVKIFEGCLYPPNLIDCPNLPSIIVSPSNGANVFICFSSAFSPCMPRLTPWQNNMGTW